MAKSIEILAKENSVKIIVDGSEIHDVVAYKLEEDKNGAFLTLTVPVERLNTPISFQQPNVNLKKMYEFFHQEQKTVSPNVLIESLNDDFVNEFRVQKLIQDRLNKSKKTNRL